MQLEELRGSPASFLVVVPTVEQLHNEAAMLRLSRTADGLEKASVSLDMKVYREDPKMVLTDDVRLSDLQQQLRRDYLAAVEAGLFTILEMAGQGCSAYARELLLRAKRSETHVSLYVSSEAPLSKVAQMMGLR